MRIVRSLLMAETSSNRGVSPVTTPFLCARNHAAVLRPCTDFQERLHDLFPSAEAVSEKHADRIQRLCGRLECSDACDKSMWHARPHIKPSIDTVGHGALDVSS